MRPTSITHERARHGAGCVSPHEKAAKKVGGKQLRGAGDKLTVAISIFEIFIELPLSLFCKLLTNFLKNLEISKNESCSTFQALQLCLKYSDRSHPASTYSYERLSLVGHARPLKVAAYGANGQVQKRSNTLCL